MPHKRHQIEAPFYQLRLSKYRRSVFVTNIFALPAATTPFALTRVCVCVCFEFMDFEIGSFFLFKG